MPGCWCTAGEDQGTGAGGLSTAGMYCILEQGDCIQKVEDCIQLVKDCIQQVEDCIRQTEDCIRRTEECIPRSVVAGTPAG